MLELNQHPSSAPLTVPLYHILTLSQTPLSSHFHPSKKKSYYCSSRSPGELVTSMLPLGLPPLQSPSSFFQAALFHLNFNPIYGLSFPLARPGLSNYSSSGLHVTRPCHKSLCWDMCAEDVCVCAHDSDERCVCVCLWWRGMSVQVTDILSSVYGCTRPL